MNKTILPEEPELVPGWLSNALAVQADFRRFESGVEAALPASPGFSEKCQTAAEMACALRRMEQARQRLGFQPFPPLDYLRGLARTVGIAITPVLEYFGLAGLRDITATSAVGFARLAQRLEMGVKETAIHVRIGFLAGVDPAPLSMLLAARRSRGEPEDALAECEAFLSEAESEMTLDTLRQLRQVESAVNAVFLERTSADV